MKETCEIWFDKDGFMHARGCPPDLKDIVELFNDAKRKLKKLGKEVADRATINLAISPQVTLSFDYHKLTKTDFNEGIKTLPTRADFNEGIKTLNERLQEIGKEIKAHRLAMEK